MSEMSESVSSLGFDGLQRASSFILYTCVAFKHTLNTYVLIRIRTGRKNKP